MFGVTGVLAHQGGWDEMLFIAAPIALFVVLLKVANSRAAHLGGSEDATDAAGDSAGTAGHEPVDHVDRADREAPPEAEAGGGPVDGAGT